MNRHAIAFSPEPQRPISYRSRRTWLRRARTLILAIAGLALVACLALGAAALIARLDVTQAQLDAAHLQGMALGQNLCRSN